MTQTQTELTATRSFEWTEYPWYPTNRHRTPRRRDVKSTVEVSIPVVASKDAPIAYRRPVSVYSIEAHDYVVTGPLDYRIHDGLLWAASQLHYQDGIMEPTPATEEALAAFSDGYYSSIETNSEHIARARYLRELPRLIVVDGLIWHTVNEPVYKVNIPTGFYARGSNLRLEVEDRPEFDGHAARAEYFPADQFEQAIAFARDYAQAEDFKFNEADAEPLRIEVTGAHTPGSTWRPAPRLMYRMPTWDAALGEYVEQLKNFRASVRLYHPEILIAADDGFGNTYKIVDRSKLSDSQAWDYDHLLEKSGDPAANPKR